MGGGKRASLSEKDEEEHAKHDDGIKMDQHEIKFNYQSQKLQTDLEMWFVDAVLDLYAKGELDELEEPLKLRVKQKQFKS